jgi:UDP-N-acetylmuramoyl-tripeptide--D-alanyl-D-alanine ligase
MPSDWTVPMMNAHSSGISAELIAELAGASGPVGHLPTAGGAAFHSGRVRPGDAFFALPGETEHGIVHADDALRRGAAFIVSDRPHPRGITVPQAGPALIALGRHARSQLTGPVIGISGSVGKTTTKSFAAAALTARSSAGNLNTPWALACTLVAAWLGDDGSPLVLELGIDRPGEMDELIDLVRPTHGLLTAIAESHLERLGDVSGVAREKARLLERSPERLAAIGAASRLPAELPGLISYGLISDGRSGLPTVPGTLSPASDGGWLLDALGVQVRLAHSGRAMAENALGALALAWRLGLDLGDAAKRLSLARLEGGRLERKQAGPRVILDDSYNSNPASAREALDLLARSPRPRCAVLGDMLELGEHSRRLHLELGAATRGFDLVLAVGESARHIAEANPLALHARNAEEAMPLLERLPPGGTVLVKASRGMRLERIVATLMAAGGDE